MTQKIYYVEERSTFGEYRPALYHGDKPSEKRAEGAVRRFRGSPVPVAPEDANKPLRAIQRLYGEC